MGAQGRGDGPVSRDLKVKVPDLTLLRSKNKGAYPLDRVMSSIDGSRARARARDAQHAGVGRSVPARA